MYSSADYVDALQYMRSHFSDVNTTMAEEPSQIEQILARLSNEDQKIISARFETMVKEIQRQRQEAQKAMEEAETLKKNASTGNQELLKWGIKNIEQQLPDDVKANFNCTGDQLMPELSSSDPEAVRRAVDRLICACSHTMMQMASRQHNAQPDPVARKRARSLSPAPAQTETAAPASIAPMQEMSNEQLQPLFNLEIIKL